MCGFFFSNKINKSKDLAKIREIERILKNRGPDNRKTIFLKKSVLSFSRLSIIDRSNRANQPYSDLSKRYFLLFNGEIYNYQILKDQLIKSGVKFKTKSDTEVLFKLLVNFGIDDTLKKIEGMFSFIFYDKKKQSLVGARDHFGQKPFYYCRYKKRILISTNIGCIKLFLKENAIDKDTIKTYISTRGLHNPQNTFFKPIKKLRAGHKFKFENGKIKISRYFNPVNLFSKKLSDRYKKISQLEREELLSNKISDSIKLNLLSDAPIGVCFSGGVDSTLAYFYASKEKYNLPIYSNFSKGIEKITFKYIPKLTKRLKIKKTNYVINDKNKYLLELSKLINYSKNVATWGGGPPMSFLCKKARKNNSLVLLSGDGLDEINLGYLTHQNLINRFHGNLYDQNVAFQINPQSPFYASKACKKYSSFLNKERKNDLNKIKKIYLNNITKKELFIKSLIIQDLGIFLQSCTLHHSDEYSMFNSIEMRQPFINIELIRFLINQPIKFLFNKKLNKPLIRYLFNKKIGKKFTDIKKEGTRNYSKYISNKNFWNFDKFLTLKIFKVNISKIKDYRIIFNFINTEIFYRMCVLNSSNFDTIVKNKSILKR